MDKLLDIEKILTDYNHKLDRHNYHFRFSSYQTEHQNIVRLSIMLKNDTNLITSIRVDSLAIELYKSCGYQVCPSPAGTNVDIVWLSKNFQTIEDLLDSLRDLGLVSGGHNIKGE